MSIESCTCRDTGMRACPLHKDYAPVTVVTRPLVMMYEGDENNIICDLWPSERVDRYEMYGMIVADLVRHIARKFQVYDDEVWEWVDKERYHPTTDIRSPS